MPRPLAEVDYCRKRDLESVCPGVEQFLPALEG